MNPLQWFVLIGHESGSGHFWYELLTMRSGELAARRSVFSFDRGRVMADMLADKYGVEDRGGMYCGCIIRVAG